jgi:predicted DNA-binding transcriptional regulator AlpA
MTSKPTPTLLAIPENDDTYIRRADVPLYIPVAAQTLARWAVEGQGPRFCKIGRRIVAYRAGDLREWLQGQVRENTIKV